MTAIIDAGPLVAFGDANDPYFSHIDALLRNLDGPLVIPAPVTAEVDYLLGRRVGRASQRNFIADLAAGRFTVACLEREDYSTIGELGTRYADLELGLADCSLVVVAHRYGTDRIVSFDERHFRAVTPLQGGAFTILPADT
ncbi:MAG TPA: PIN domain-containing protein [Solirubrobacteraceae bacterium]|nr:PIN domain-containing protein [Solirubrobacteraceae bacterium]